MMESMAVRTETVQVIGIRCERCVQRLGAALQPLEGLEQANANLMETLTRAGFERSSLAE